LQEEQIQEVHYTIGKLSGYVSDKKYKNVIEYLFNSKQDKTNYLMTHAFQIVIVEATFRQTILLANEISSFKPVSPPGI